MGRKRRKLSLVTRHHLAKMRKYAKGSGQRKSAARALKHLRKRYGLTVARGESVISKARAEQ